MPTRRSMSSIGLWRSRLSARIASRRRRCFKRCGLDLGQPAESLQQKEAAATERGAADDHDAEADAADERAYRQRGRERIGLADRVIRGRFHEEINRPCIGEELEVAMHV